MSIFTSKSPLKSSYNGQLLGSSLNSSPLRLSAPIGTSSPVIGSGLKSSIRGESRFEYIPVEKAWVEHIPQQRTDYIPVERKTTDYQVVEHQTEYIPQSRYEPYTDYQPVQSTEYIPYQRTEYVPVERTEYIPQQRTDYIPQQKFEEKIDYIPQQRQISHGIQESGLINSSVVGSGQYSSQYRGPGPLLSNSFVGQGLQSSRILKNDIYTSGAYSSPYQQNFQSRSGVYGSPFTSSYTPKYY